MKFPSSPERRERPSRAAAPTKNMKEPDSDDDDQPIRPQSSSSARVIRADKDNSSVGFSPDSITVISAQSSASSMATLNRPISPKKRNSPETESESPTKKSRKIVIKTNKSTQAVTPAPSQAGITPQPARSTIPEIEAMHKFLTQLESRMNRNAADRDEEKKNNALLKQALQDAQTAKAGKKDLTHPTDDQDLLNENEKLKRRISEQNHYIATLRQDRIAPSSFKLMDSDVELEWKGIAFEIRNFVSQVLTKRPYRDSAPRGANQRDVEAFKKRQRKDIYTAPYHFQRYIWVRLVEDIFQAGKATWGGPAGNAFHRYCLNISGMFWSPISILLSLTDKFLEIDFEGMTQLSAFKSSQAEVMSKFSDEYNREQTMSIAREMALTLEIFMDPEEKKARTSPQKRLMDIVRKAVKLNDKFLRSRAFYLINWLQSDWEWNDLEIHHFSGEEGGVKNVDVEISPRLRKIGNADGHHFDQALEMCQPMVTVVLL
ncbi:hypothetical protein FLAG1_00232 [Fusarium langsethiae]|uniref:Uncharacterized protein n=1 Tax=Fusarium langsethiae TaxID=179993 RepID=A0A0N0V8U0_FUSLA|nr:hypothetical protein FLAG1_00232 [Fusarium langsethiae]GKT97769.1 unnamed protein product [Fusarium langsethiae]GKU10647.1 unnamed protein product [Fusarium langsethiae]